MIVVDASVLVTGLGDDGADGATARSRLRGERLTAPHLIDLEVVSAWRRLVSVGELSERRAGMALRDLFLLRLQRVAHREFVHRCWELRDNMTMYDACYVALAEALDVVLVTADQRLANAPGSRCAIELLS